MKRAKNFLEIVNIQAISSANQAIESEKKKEQEFKDWLSKNHQKMNDPNARSYSWLASLIEA